MEQLTPEQAAAHYAKMLYPGASESNANYTNALGDFKAGAEWQQRQYKRIIDLLKGIAECPGNLPDEQYLTKSGPNDAAMRGGLVVFMRAISIEAMRVIDPSYNPLQSQPS